MSRAAGVRRSARLLLVDPLGAVLLVRGHDPRDAGLGSWWFTPGGGVEEGESLADAARREAREETGLVVAELGPVVHVDSAAFAFDGGWLEQENHFFRLEVERFEPVADGWTPLERDSLEGWRWWTPAELRATTERYYPADLPALLRGIRRSGPGRR